MRALLRFASLAVMVLAPAAAYAQASIAGVVKDSSGAVLPGVTVTAASQALIEKARSAATDGSGLYRIVSLPPGTYDVTFALPGFSTVRHDGVQLTGAFVVTINVGMTVGAAAETITVTGETPIVDVRSLTRQTQITQAIVSEIPTSRNPFTAGVLIPGIKRGPFMSQDVGGSVVQDVASLESNNSRTADQKMMINGVALSTMIGGGWGGGFTPSATGTAEFAIDSSAVDAQVATGGVRINFIPRDGGNRFAGTIVASVAREGFASDNFNGGDAQARGLRVANRIKGSGDFNPGFGGPLKRDRIWFFLSGRHLYADNYVGGQFFNANANSTTFPAAYRFSSTGKQAILHQEQNMAEGRFTIQANRTNKIDVTYDHETLCSCPAGVTALVSPEAARDRRFPLERFVQVGWTSPMTSRLLFEASAIQLVERWGNMHLQTGEGENVSALAPGIVSITDNPSLATGAPLTFASAAEFNNSWNWNVHYRAAVSYITGSHALRVGFNNAYGHFENTIYTDPTTPYSYNFANGVPSQLVYRITPRTVQVDVDLDMGLFVQDTWTIDKWTLFGGVRYDHFKNSFPPQSIAPTALAPRLNISYDTIKNLNWQDVTPKMGATYDAFGNGRTALKVTLNKYLEGLGTTSSLSDPPNPINRLAGILTNSTRPWSDSNGNFTPDCDLLNYDTNGECGPLQNAATFGTFTPGFTYDPDLLNGWGRRGYNWEFGLGIQQELMPRLALDGQYARRWYGNFVAQDDLSVGRADYTTFTISAPRDPRLPNGGGYTVTGFDLTPAGATTAQNVLVTRAQHYGSQSEVYDGFTLVLRARLKGDLLLQAGGSTGRVVLDDCDVVDTLPEMLLQSPPPVIAVTRAFVFTARPLERCHQNRGWRTAAQGFASYVIPRIDVRVAGTFQNLPGNSLSANANVLSAQTTLGREFSGGAPFRSLNIIEEGTLFIERLNQIDVRVAKILRFGQTRTSVNLDFYNVLNAGSVLTENATYGAAWRTPTSIVLPRLFKVGVQFDF
jgi:hypothetical protein